MLGTVLTKGIHKGRVDGVELAGRGRGGVTRSRRCDKVEAAGRDRDGGARSVVTRGEHS